jgi:hypothetical protein
VVVARKGNDLVFLRIHVLFLSLNNVGNDKEKAFITKAATKFGEAAKVEGELTRLRKLSGEKMKSDKREVSPLPIQSPPACLSNRSFYL